MQCMKKSFLIYGAFLGVLIGSFYLPISPFYFIKKPAVFLGRLFANSYQDMQKLDQAELALENQVLKKEMQKIKAWLLQKEHIEQHITKIEAIEQKRGYGKFYAKDLSSLKNQLQMQTYSLTARVIYRDPSFWSSGFWIDKGSLDNQKCAKDVIQKNSPVLIGSCLLGVVEQVEKNRSYVRLITDAKLKPAVRVARGSLHTNILIEEIEKLEKNLQNIFALDVLHNFLQETDLLKKELEREKDSKFLAKGILQGSSMPIWRCAGKTLKGVGFNYDFADEQGEARQLHCKHKESLIEEGDLLVTSGLDGLFPENLPVARVEKIFPLKEGAYFYELLAKPVIDDLDEITFVQICSPLVGK